MLRLYRISPSSALLAFGLAVGLGLGGCAPRKAPPAPVINHGAGTAGPGAGLTAVTVRESESVYDIARRTNLPLRDIIDANHLRPPYALAPGQRLTLPAPREYTVQRGDTLYGISRMFGLDLKEMAQANGLSEPYGVEVGKTLRLTGTGTVAGSSSGGAPAAAAAAAPSSAPSQRVEVAPLDGGPASGSSKSGSGAVKSEPLPAPALAAEAAATPETAGHALPAAPLPSSHGAPPPSSHGATAPSPVVSAAPAAAPPPAGKGGPRLSLPLKGRVLSGFGPKPDGMHNDGINIAAEKGTTVQAAADGTVVYAGNELRGFGNLLLLRHADGWMTAYAHLDSFKVARGAGVKRGQPVGVVGQTGSVTAPQLHFEVRRGSQAVDPTGYLEGAL